jgi:NAD(P)-dependent dehydrogenase (short-subunit alcohol dehydrogenase family)
VKTVLVTGAARGIGAAIASRFAADGWRVIAADIDGSTPHHVDVTDPASVAALVSAAGPIDVVVNNAGVVHVAPFLSVPLSDWRKVFSVNVEGCLNVTQAVARVMLTQQAGPDGCRGRIINIGSPAAEAPRPLLAAYGASKAAIKHLSRSAAAALGPDGIWVTVVYPTNVEDGMWRSLPDGIAAASGRDRDAVIAERLATAPTGRFETGEEVAAMVMYAATAPGLNGKLVWTEAHVDEL